MAKAAHHLSPCLSSPEVGLLLGVEGQRPMGYRPALTSPGDFRQRRGAPGATRGAFVAAARSSMRRGVATTQSASRIAAVAVECSDALLKVSRGPGTPGVTQKPCKSASSTRSPAAPSKSAKPALSERYRPPPTLPELVGMLAGDTLGVRMTALQSLQACATNEGSRSSMVASGAPGLLVAMVADMPRVGLELGRMSLLLLTSLALESAGRAAILASGAVPTFLKLLPRLTGEVQELVLSLLGGLAARDAGGIAADRVRAEMVAQGVVPPLLALLRSHSARAVSLASAALAHIATYHGNSARIVELGAIAPLLDSLLPSADPEVQAKAAWALANIASTNRSRNVLLEANAISALAQLLKDGPLIAKAQAAGALAALATRDPKDRMHIASLGDEDEDEDVDALPLDGHIFLDAGVMEPLVALLSDSDAPEAQAQAAHAVMQLAVRHPLQEPIIAAGALPLLVKLLSEGSMQSQGYAGAALRFLAISSARLEAIEAAIPAPTSDSPGAGDDSQQARLLRKIRHYCR
mmetsp:Transcript_1801/g.4638  ORF Transcript_1801/g.4638 Transcript_1801/m.4638 type:complete len:524 (-) Transcript_1801:9-1580(-)